LIYLNEYEPDAFACITDDLAAVVDGFQAFEFAPAAQPQESELRVSFRDSRGPIPAPQLSDGTLNLIGLTAILRSPRQFRFLCLEEPEIGLTPRSIEHLVRIIAEGPTPLGIQQPQVMITTHSPYLVSGLLDHFSATNRRGDLAIVVISNDPDLDRTVAEPLEGAAEAYGYDQTLELQPDHITSVMRGLLG
jgi:predicted ATPase